MKKTIVEWLSEVSESYLKDLSDRFLPAHPLAALFLLLGAILFFFAGLTALILGVWFALGTVLSQEVAIWTLFGILAFSSIFSLIVGLLFLRPKKSRRYKRVDAPPTLEGLITSFIDGFFKG